MGSSLNDLEYTIYNKLTKRYFLEVFNFISQSKKVPVRDPIMTKIS